jgi:DNA-binding transcriptional LysR family regulator
MDRRHLQYYVALAEELHFGRAALRLGIATPTLSVQIQQIERRLGTPLFDRSRREVTLTSAGAIFLAEARNVLRQFEQAEAVGRRAGRGEIGRIEIGYVGSAVHAGALQEQLQRFRSASPDVELKVGEWPMADLPDLLLDGRIDVVFCRLPMEVPDALGSHILIEDQFCVALPASHALAHAGVPVQPALLAKEAFIMPEQPAGTLEVARRGGFVPDIRSRPGHLVAVLAQV